MSAACPACNKVGGQPIVRLRPDQPPPWCSLCELPPLQIPAASVAPAGGVARSADTPEQEPAVAPDPAASLAPGGPGGVARSSAATPGTRTPAHLYEDTPDRSPSPSVLRRLGRDLHQAGIGLGSPLSNESEVDVEKSIWAGGGGGGGGA